MVRVVLDLGAGKFMDYNLICCLNFSSAAVIKNTLIKAIKSYERKCLFWHRVQGAVNHGNKVQAFVVVCHMMCAIKEEQ